MPVPSLYRQAASLFEREGLPLPAGAVPAGTAPVVAVAAAPSHTGNAVLVEMRREGGPAEYLRVISEPALQEAVQWFRAMLPVLEKGRQLDYRVALVRAGQLLATLPADGSWLRVTGDPAAPPPVPQARPPAAGAPTPAAAPSSPVPQAPARAAAAPSPPATPRWAYDLEFFAALNLSLRPEAIGMTPEGYRINLLVQHGRALGPHFEAAVRGEGGDFLTIRGDGIGILDIRTIWETRDGALILFRAGGRLELGPDGCAKLQAGEFTGSPPFYATPTFITAHPAWLWLNRLQAFGLGRALMEEKQVEYDVYVPHVQDRLGDA